MVERKSGQEGVGHKQVIKHLDRSISNDKLRLPGIKSFYNSI